MLGCLRSRYGGAGARYCSVQALASLRGIVLVSALSFPRTEFPTRFRSLAMNADSSQPVLKYIPVKGAYLKVQVDQRILEYLKVDAFKIKYTVGSATLQAVVRNIGNRTLETTDLSFAFYGDSGVKVSGQAALDADIRPNESTHLTLFNGDARFFKIPTLLGMFAAPVITFILWFLGGTILSLIAGNSDFLIAASVLLVYISVPFLLGAMLLTCLRPDFFMSGEWHARVI